MPDPLCVYCARHPAIGTLHNLPACPGCQAKRVRDYTGSMRTVLIQPTACSPYGPPLGQWIDQQALAKNEPVHQETQRALRAIIRDAVEQMAKDIVEEAKGRTPHG